MSDPKRYGFPMCECDATDEFHMEEMGMAELKDGGFVLWEDYAALKAEIQMMKTSSMGHGQSTLYESMAKENEKLKLENKRLEKDFYRLLQKHLFNKSINSSLASECKCLKDEKAVCNTQVEKINERLIKAGDSLCKSLSFEYPDSPSVAEWNLAKKSIKANEKSPSFIEDLGNGVEKHDLKFRVPSEGVYESNYKRMVEQYNSIIDVQLKVICELNDKINRLEDAGDKVLSEWSSGEGTDLDNFTKGMWIWTVAKDNNKNK